MSRSKVDLLASLDDFTRAYIECALWSSTDDSRPDGGDPMDQNYGPEDLTVAALRSMIADCAAFQAAHDVDLCNALAVGAPHYRTASAGHDFWLTRNRHGAGFWDRGLGDVGKRLTDAAHAYGSSDLYLHRGRIHVS